MRAIERLKSWDRTLSPETVAGTIYQAFLLRLAREFTRAAIGDRDLADRYLDRADNGFIAHVTSPWRWHSHLLALWEEGDEELIGGSWDELVLDALRGALDDLEERFGPDPEQWQWGRVHALQFPHALGGAHPVAERVFNRTLHPGGGQETVAQIAYDPNDPYEAIWAPSWRMLADPAAPGALAVAGVHRPVGPRLEPSLRRPPAALGDGRDPVDGGRGAVRDAGALAGLLMPSRRDQIKLTDEELAELLEDRARRDRLLDRAARLAPLDAALVRAARRRDLDLDLRQVAEGEEPRARSAGHAADRDRRRVRRAARECRSRRRPS